MSKIIESVNCIFADEDLKEMINHFSGTKSIYEYFRNNTLNEKNNGCEGVNEFLFNLFNQYQKTIKPLSESGGENIFNKTDNNMIEKMNLGNFCDIKDLFSDEVFKLISKKPFWPERGNESSRFIHLTNNCLNSFEEENIECSLYLSPEMKNIIPIVGKIIQKHNELGISCYLKFNTNCYDNDRIVLYSSFKNLDKHLEIIENIKLEDKTLFSNMGRNKLWGKINSVEGVYFGEEPFLFNYKSSYSSIRSTIIDEALLDFFNKYTDYKTNEEITEEMLRYFKEKIHLHSLANNINPYNFCLNMSRKINKQRTPIRLGIDSNRPLSVTVEYIYPDDDTVTITALKYYRDSDSLLTISKEDLELLYLRDKEDINYDKSNKKREEIYNKLEKLHKKNKFENALNKMNLIKQYHDSMNIQTTYEDDGLTNNVCIDYGLYKVLPVKASELLCLIKLRKQNRKQGFVEIKATEEISKMIDEITSNNRAQVKVIENVIQEFFDKELTLEESKKLVKKR